MGDSNLYSKMQMIRSEQDNLAEMHLKVQASK